MDTTDVRSEARRVGVVGYWNVNLDVVGCAAALELRSRLEGITLLVGSSEVRCVQLP